MRSQSLDATILLETPPEFEIRDGLFYVTDIVGGLVIRRVMRPHTFEKSMRHCAKLLADWRRGRSENVLRFPEQADIPDDMDREWLGGT